MKADVAKQWIAALRSGNYQQGFGQLHKNGAFCALGVLCDIVKPGGWKKDVIVGGMQMDCQATKLSHDLLEQAGIRNSDVRLRDGQPIVYLNDKARLTFAELADMIEDMWEQI